MERDPNRRRVREIDAAVAALVAVRRAEVVQIGNNATNASARQKLIEIQATIDSLQRAREHELDLED